MIQTAGSRDRDGGFSLTELLVAMMLFGIVLVVAGGLFTSVSRGFSLASNTVSNTKAVSNIMNEATRVIRAGTANPVEAQQNNDPAFVSASRNSVTLYAYINTDTAAERPVMIRLDLDGLGNLRESRWPATQLSNGYWSFPCRAGSTCTTPATTVRILGGNIDSSATLFRYLKADGNELAVPGTGFTVDQLGTIAAVKVTITARLSDTLTSDTVTLTNTVGIPNLGFTRTGG